MLTGLPFKILYHPGIQIIFLDAYNYPRPMAFFEFMGKELYKYQALGMIFLTFI